MPLHLKRFVLLWVGLAFTAAGMAQERVEVITLRYRSAAEVIPLIQPLVGAEGAVTGMQNRLIVRTTAERLAQIRAVLEGIDSAPRRLFITVRMGGRDAGQDTGAAVSGSIGPGGRLDARVWSEARDGVREDEQRIQVLEGGRAFIRTGTSQPYRSRIVTRDAWGRTVVQETTEFRDVDTGFEVVPRLFGERVVLDIHPRRSRLAPDGRVAVEAAATTVSGRLGEWIELGGVATSGMSQGSGIAYGERETETRESRIRVRVELAGD